MVGGRGVDKLLRSIFVTLFRMAREISFEEAGIADMVAMPLWSVIQRHILHLPTHIMVAL